MENEQAKIFHHHTPRQYLLPWADADERIAWFGYGKVKRSGLTVVGGENDFYKLKELTVPDVDCIKLFIDGLPELSRKVHKDFLEMYVLPTQLKKRLAQRVAENGKEMDKKQLAEARRLLNVAISNLNEDFHASIERKFWPYLDLIKKHDFSFYEDPARSLDFFHGLSMQYMRTKAVKLRALNKTSVLFDNIERVWDVLSRILAVQMGGSFFVDRRNYQILVLENETQVPFITSDQPIINMLSDPHGFNAPERVELYYPLSPTQAMLYLEKSTPTAGISRYASIDDAHRYNRMMLDHSGLRVFSNSEEYLTFLKKCADVKKQSP